MKTSQKIPAMPVVHFTIRVACICDEDGTWFQAELVDSRGRVRHQAGARHQCPLEARDDCLAMLEQRAYLDVVEG